MCILEEFGVFPGLLCTKVERFDWHKTSNEALESEGERTKHAARSETISHVGVVPGTSLDLYPCNW